MIAIIDLNLDVYTKRFIRECIKYSRENTIFTIKPIFLLGVNKPVYALFKTTAPKTIHDILEIVVFIQNPELPQFASDKYNRFFYTGLQLDSDGYYFFSTTIFDNKIKIKLDDMILCNTYSAYDK